MPSREDFHTHSTASDGSLTPVELVDAAADAGVERLALTDHDTVAGLAQAAGQARRRGIDLVPGVELSTRWEGRTLHLVGLGVNPEDAALKAGLARLASLREVRAGRMAERLARLGLADVGPAAQQLAAGTPTRTHFARALVAQGHAKDSQDAFKRLLRRGKPGYVASEWVPLGEAMGWVHAAGGRAVLAHPHRYKLTGAWMRRLLSDFQALGGDAIEVVCGNTPPSQIQHLAGLARRFGFLASSGSDFHTPVLRWHKLGQLPSLPRDLVSVGTQLEAGHA